MRIKEILKEKQMTQIQLADKLGIAKQHLSNMLTGQKGITFPMAERIADALGVPFWQLHVSPKDALAEMKSSVFAAFVYMDGESRVFATPQELKAFAETLPGEDRPV